MSNVSIVIPTYNEGESLFLTVEAVLHTCPPDIEILIVNDGSNDGSLDFLETGEWPQVKCVDLDRKGIAHARNEGARRAKGETLIFLDAHCIPKRGWLPPLLEALDRHPEGIVAPCITVLGHTLSKGYGADLDGQELGFRWRSVPDSAEPHDAPLACGCCMVMRRDYLLRIAAFDPIRVYGMEDTELCIRVWLLGGRVRIVPESEVAHLFKASAQYHVEWRDFLYNRLRVACLHFEGERLDRILAHQRSAPCFDEAMELLNQSDVWARRDEFRAQRLHDADWFCERFAVAI